MTSSSQRYPVRRIRLSQISVDHSCIAALLFSTLVILGPAVEHSALGQPAEQQEFTVTMRDPREKAESIKLAMNRQVILETSEPVTRVETTSQDVVRVDVPDPTHVLLTGQQYGITQVLLWTDDGRQFVYEVSVELDLELLNQTIKDLDPLSDARALSVMGNILLIGTVSGADISEQVVGLAPMFLPRITRDKTQIQNLLSVSGEQQVLLKCVVAEISRTASRTLTVNGFLAGENVRDGFIVNTIGGVNPINIQPQAGSLVSEFIPYLIGDVPIAPAANLVLGFPRANFTLFMQAMNDNQLARVLAEPTLTAISGETATFLVGGEFPVPVPQGGSAAGAITIEYKQFGVILVFTPYVMPNQRIRLNVRPEISLRDDTRGVVTGSGFVPAITARRAQTTVELESGSTISIAGLLSDEVAGVASEVPWLGDIPIIGSLFRSVNYLRRRTELVILVTPEIVAPMMPDEVPELPGASHRDPTDIELFLSGNLEGAPPVDEFDAPYDDTTSEDVARSRPLRPSEPDKIMLHGPWGPADASEVYGSDTELQP